MQQLDIEKAIKEIQKMGFEQWLTKEMVKAFEEARKGKLKTSDEHKFEVNWMENVRRVVDSVLDETYKPSSSVAFVIREPMVREIFAAPFRDRIVQHFLYNMQGGWWDKRFINDAYSCRVGKGTLYGIKRAQKMMRQVTKGGREKAWIIKLDIKGYFMSLSRKKLYEQVKWGLEQQFGPYMDTPEGFRLYKTCEFLWKQVIFDDPVMKAWKRGNPADWDPNNLPPEKSLFMQPDGQGIVIGNLTSQLVSNIFLNRLDRYVKYTLGYKYYGRYVDDFFIMVPDKDLEKAKQDIAKIEKFLKEELGLTLHKKKRYIQPVSHGMEFIGARIYPTCLYPSDRMQKNFKKAARKCANGAQNKDSLESYIGMMKHLDAKRFINDTLEEEGLRKKRNSEDGARRGRR